MKDQGRESCWIERAVLEHEGRLLAYVARLLGDVERARDVVQDAFARLWQQDRSEVEPRVCEWLYTVCRNRALDVKQKESRQVDLGDVWRGDEDSRPRPDEVMEQKESAATVMKMMSRLPEREQEVLRLKFQGGMSYEEIARVMGLSASNVGFLIHSAVKKLRDRMGVVIEKV